MMKERSRLFVSLRAVVIAIALIAVLVPFLYLFLNSVKIEREFRSIPLRIIPSVITLQYYADIFGRGGHLDAYLLNSVVVTFAVVVVSVFTGAVAAFGLAKLRRMYRFIALGVYLILLVRFYPKVVMLIPYFILMRDLHLLDTLAAVVIAHSSIGIPFVVWLMIGFYEEIPVELEESAMLDGCDVWRRFTRVIFPVVLPGIATAAIMTAVLSWNEFLIASSVVSINAKTLPVLVSGFISDKGINWGPMSATSVVIIVPMFIFVLFTQKYLVRGLTFGAVKG
jgi:multiple sugar transport system permease protein